jgi:hypothetical protein
VYYIVQRMVETGDWQFWTEGGEPAEYSLEEIKAALELAVNQHGRQNISLMKRVFFQVDTHVEIIDQ